MAASSTRINDAAFFASLPFSLTASSKYSATDFSATSLLASSSLNLYSAINRFDFSSGISGILLFTASRSSSLTIKGKAKSGSGKYL